MKKLYTLLLGAVVALSASASALAPQPIASKMAKPTKQMTAKLSLKSFAKDAPSKIGANVSIDEIAGEYEWTYTNAIEPGGDAVGTAILEIKDADAGVLSLTLGNWTIEATYSKGNLSIAPGQDLGYNQANKMQVYTYHWHWVPDGDDYTTSPLDTPMIGSASFDDNDSSSDHTTTSSLPNQNGKTSLCLQKAGLGIVLLHLQTDGRLQVTELIQQSSHTM